MGLYIILPAHGTVAYDRPNRLRSAIGSPKTVQYSTSINTSLPVLLPMYMSLYCRPTVLYYNTGTGKCSTRTNITPKRKLVSVWEWLLHVLVSGLDQVSTPLC